MLKPAKIKFRQQVIKAHMGLGIEKTSVKGKHNVYFDAILTFHNAYPLVQKVCLLIMLLVNP